MHLTWWKAYCLFLIAVSLWHVWTRGDQPVRVTDVYCVLINVATIALWRL